MEQAEIFVGDMGIQEIYLGDVLIYKRESSYCYLELSTNDKGD